MLKQVKMNMEVIEKIEKSEKQIVCGKCIRANTDMNPEEIDDLLMA